MGKQQSNNLVELARKQRHVALMQKVQQAKALTPKELAELEELEAASQAKKAPKPTPKKKPATVAKRPRRRRLNRKYRAHVEQIAAIFVATGGSALQTEEQVRERIPELDGFRHTSISRWVGNTEWEVALKAAREDKRFEDELAAAKRSKNFIRWAMERTIELKAEHAQAREDKRKADITMLEGRIIKLNEAMRAEETHLGRLERTVLDGTDGLSLVVTFGGRPDETEREK